MTASDRKAQLALAFLLTIGSYLLYFHAVGERSIWSPDEDEYALVNREMVREGHWVYPTVNGRSYSIKPPLFNWLGSAFSVLHGEVDELTCRLPSAIAALVGVALLYLLGRRLFGARAGVLSAAVLATSPLYIEFGRWIQINMISTTLLVATLWLFQLGYSDETRRRRAYLWMYVPIGLGTLNMGLVNVVMPAVVIFSYLLVRRDLRHVGRLELPLGILVYLAVAAPWYAIVSLEGSYAYDLIVKTNFTRYMGEFQHRRPFYYYLTTTFPYFLPWAFFLPGAFFAVFSRRTAGDRGALLFPFVWLASLFLFFSISKTKRSEYLLPVFPAMALLVGYVLDRAITHASDSETWCRLVRWPSRLSVGLLLVVSVGALGYALVAAPDWVRTVWPIAAAGTTGTVLAVVLLRKRLALAAFATIIATMALQVAWTTQEVVARVDDATSARLFALRAKELTAAEETLKMFQFYAPVYGFYAEKRMEDVPDVEALERCMRSKEPVHVVIKEKVFEKVRAETDVPMYVALRMWVDHRYVLLVSNRPVGDDER